MNNCTYSYINLDDNEKQFFKKCFCVKLLKWAEIYRIHLNVIIAAR